MEAYVAHRLWVARGSTAVTFEKEAFDLIQQFTDGVPRVINLLCDRALMQGAEMRVNRLTPDIIRQAAANRGLRQRQPAASPRTFRWWWLVAVLGTLLIVAVALAMGPAGVRADLLEFFGGLLPAAPASPPAP